jgi:hypothetical protein
MVFCLFFPTPSPPKKNANPPLSGPASRVHPLSALWIAGTTTPRRHAGQRDPRRRRTRHPSCLHRNLDHQTHWRLAPHFWQLKGDLAPPLRFEVLCSICIAHASGHPIQVVSQRIRVFVLVFSGGALYGKRVRTAAAASSAGAPLPPRHIGAKSPPGEKNQGLGECANQAAGPIHSCANLYA